MKRHTLLGLGAILSVVFSGGLARASTYICDFKITETVPVRFYGYIDQNNEQPARMDADFLKDARVISQKTYVKDLLPENETALFTDARFQKSKIRYKKSKAKGVVITQEIDHPVKSVVFITDHCDSPQNKKASSCLAQFHIEALPGAFETLTHKTLSLHRESKSRSELVTTMKYDVKKNQFDFQLASLRSLAGQKNVPIEKKSITTHVLPNGVVSVVNFIKKYDLDFDFGGQQSFKKTINTRVYFACIQAE